MFDDDDMPRKILSPEDSKIIHDVTDKMLSELGKNLDPFNPTQLMTVLSLMVVRAAVIIARGDQETVAKILEATKKMVDANAIQEIDSYREVKGMNRPEDADFKKAFN